MEGSGKRELDPLNLLDSPDTILEGVDILMKELEHGSRERSARSVRIQSLKIGGVTSAKDEILVALERLIKDAEQLELQLELEKSKLVLQETELLQRPQDEEQRMRVGHQRKVVQEIDALFNIRSKLLPLVSEKTKLASDGNTEATMWLADWLVSENTPLDAVSLYLLAHKRAPERPEPLISLGLLHRNGEGLQKDALSALSLLEQAAKLGSAEAMRHIGTIFSQGDAGVDQNVEAAIQWWTAAAESGDETADEILQMTRLELERAAAAGNLREELVSALNLSGPLRAVQLSEKTLSSQEEKCIESLKEAITLLAKGKSEEGERQAKVIELLIKALSALTNVSPESIATVVTK